MIAKLLGPTITNLLAKPLVRYLLIGLAVAALSAVTAVAGWYKAHADCKAQQQATKTVTKIVDRVITVTDDAAVTRLQRAQATHRAREQTLLNQIEAASRANPAPIGCRLPDSLRDAINADLQAGAQ